MSDTIAAFIAEGEALITDLAARQKALTLEINREYNAMTARIRSAGLSPAQITVLLAGLQQLLNEGNARIQGEIIAEQNEIAQAEHDATCPHCRPQGGLN